jgi:hypothetical protein
MKEHEIMLEHGEVNVTIEMGEKTIESGWGCTYFQQQMFVTMVDCFDDITLDCKAVLEGDALTPEWNFTKAELFVAGIENDLEAGTKEFGEAIISANQMATELVDNHNFLEAMTETFWR